VNCAAKMKVIDFPHKNRLFSNSPHPYTCMGKSYNTNNILGNFSEKINILKMQKALITDI
jgi:hypothetical protein